MSSMFPQPTPKENNQAEAEAVQAILDVLNEELLEVSVSPALALQVLEAVRKFKSSCCPVCTTELDGDGYPVVD